MKQEFLQKQRKIIRILDELLSHDEWETSLFLRTAKKRLSKMRTDAAAAIAKLGVDVDNNKEDIDAPLPENHLKVYISLYQTEGNNLQLWQNMLKSLQKYSITRPVYSEEEHVRENIRSKPEIERHAYVVVAINKNDIIHVNNPSQDKLGHPLLTMHERAVRLANIIEFVHANKKHYRFDGKVLHLRLK